MNTPYIWFKGLKVYTWSKEQAEQANPTPVAADDIPCERIEYPCGFVGGEPSASITKRLVDEKPVPPICDCGGAAAGTPHANWCSTRRRK